MAMKIEHAKGTGTETTTIVIDTTDTMIDVNADPKSDTMKDEIDSLKTDATDNLKTDAMLLLLPLPQTSTTLRTHPLEMTNVDHVSADTKMTIAREHLEKHPHYKAVTMSGPVITLTVRPNAKRTPHQKRQRLTPMKSTVVASNRKLIETAATLKKKTTVIQIGTKIEDDVKTSEIEIEALMVDLVPLL